MFPWSKSTITRSASTPPVVVARPLPPTNTMCSSPVDSWTIAQSRDNPPTKTTVALPLSFAQNPVLPRRFWDRIHTAIAYAHNPKPHIDRVCPRHATEHSALNSRASRLRCRCVHRPLAHVPRAEKNSSTTTTLRCTGRRKACRVCPVSRYEARVGCIDVERYPAMARLAHRLPLQSLDGVEPGKPQSTPPTQNTTQSRLQLPNSVPQPPLSVAVLIAMPIAPPAAATVDHSFPQETDPAPENIVIGISQTWFLEEGHRR
ncbi:hypothetical protein MIND_00116500 [Mycena indigotica]|uniref:Uncharacterized protein n=1 Tax=Mycena indigotica TaxID=2126181 RepID=A0A8H6WFP8_9AGAR|nr:uncharacterized protein MIND_00116500 [Mycena indigotica]KAF7315992.1 hypothetical protein MIND_00116500 [Mycena indigotica]